MNAHQIRENLTVAFESVVRQKTRSLLTILGVVIGVASVISVAAIIEGLNHNIISRVQAMGSKAFFIGRIPAGTFGRLPEHIRLRKHFKYEDIRVLRECCPHVEYATAFLTRAAFFNQTNEARYRNEQAQNVILRGVDEDYSAAIPMFDVAEGRTITRYDQSRARFVAAIGQAIAGDLFPHVDPIGRTIRVNGVPFEVIGVFQKDEGLFGGPGVDQFIVIPYTTFQKLYPEIEEHFLAISVRETSDLAAALDEVVPALRRIRHVRPNQENDFEVTLPDFLTKLWDQLTGALFLLTFAISSIALLVGGIGVMNIMLVSVTERTREIGVRKAVGARRQDVRLQFLVEAVVLTLVGGVVGILAGAAVAWTASMLVPSFPFYLSPFWVAMGVGMAVGVGVFFGYYPANRAAELDPIVALRYE
jgi:putative ABC transport system permease protein